MRMFHWFHQKGYAQGVFWIALVSLISSSNDILMRLLGSRLDGMEIAFFRFFFATLVLLPVMWYHGRSAFQTGRPMLHLFRALLGFGAVSLWCYGVGRSPLAVAATMALTVPIWVLPMAWLFLGERIGWQRFVATCAGFLGIIITVVMGHQGLSWQAFITGTGAWLLLLSSIMFALSDILNKKMIHHEGVLAMLFYFALGTSLASYLPAQMVWLTPTWHELFYLLLLGAGGNFILFCLLKAFAATEVSALAPFRYLELLFAMTFGYVLFAEVLGFYALLGAAIIVSSTLAIAYFEAAQKKKLADDTAEVESEPAWSAS